MNKLEKFFLITILVLSIALRFYKLGQVPSGFTWDEAAVGYNAWTIGNWGRDEWGRLLPLTFKSFGDFKNPVHVYFTVPFVSIFGLNEFATRFAPALFGVLNTLALYFLALKIFKNTKIALLTSFLFTISPFNIQFSRFNHELNFALFFFLTGFYFFLKAVEEKKGNLLILSYFLFAIDLVTYHSSKFVVGVFVLVLTAFFLKQLLALKKTFFVALLMFFGFIGLIFLNRELLGLDRLGQTALTQDVVENSPFYKKTGNTFLATLNIHRLKYMEYFSRHYLFLSGDPNPRHSTQFVGIFYKIEYLSLVLGFIVLLLKSYKNKLVILLFIWVLLAPVPATFGVETPHAARALFMSGGLHIISAYGFYTIINLFNKNYLKYGLSLVFISTLFLSCFNYIKYYFTEYDDRYSVEWQYGMREAFSFLEGKREYYKIYITDTFSQPYIFALFYTKTPLPDFLKTVEYNKTDSKSSNLVKSFNNFQFGLWDQIESFPDPHILYVLPPSNYNGLRYKHSFNIDKLVKYPEGDNVFYLVSGVPTVNNNDK